MSYIRNKDTYCYPGDAGLVINTNHCVDQASINIGAEKKSEFYYRYLVQLPQEEFEQLAREIVLDVFGLRFPSQKRTYTVSKRMFEKVFEEWRKERETV
jgi:hypothetical protein